MSNRNSFSLRLSVILKPLIQLLLCLPCHSPHLFLLFCCWVWIVNVVNEPVYQILYCFCRQTSMGLRGITVLIIFMSSFFVLISWLQIPCPYFGMTKGFSHGQIDGRPMGLKGIDHCSRNLPQVSFFPFNILSAGFGMTLLGGRSLDVWCIQTGVMWGDKNVIRIYSYKFYVFISKRCQISDS